MLAVVVHAANIHDTKPGILAAERAIEKYPSIQRFYADAGYRKTFEKAAVQKLNRGVDIVEKLGNGWHILPNRWIVERTIAWLNNSRRLSKDYEISVVSAQVMCVIAALCILIARF